MAKRPSEAKDLQLKLLEESLWNVEDRVNVMLESIADHEAELVRLKRLTSLALERLGKVEGLMAGKMSHSNSHGKQ